MSSKHNAAIAEAMEFARDAVALLTEDGRCLYGFPALPLLFVFDKPDAPPLDLAKRILEQSLIAKLQTERALLMAVSPEGVMQ